MAQKQAPSPMPLFVLAAVSRGGLQSLYELQRGVSLQPGGIQPVLGRLEKDGLLDRQAQDPPRRRRLLKVSDKGEQTLTAEWRNCLRDYPDPESTLRAAAVAILMQDRFAAVGYLLGSADAYEFSLRRSPSEAPKNRTSAIVRYESMRDAWEIARRQSAARVFREIAEKLQREE